MEKRQIIIFGLLILGLVATVYLTQKQQIFKSKADVAEIKETLNITDEDGHPLEYIGNKTFKTSSKRINIGNKNLQLINSE